MTKNLTNQTRVFFVVDSLEANEQLFTTYGEAKRFYQELQADKHELARIRVCLVNNAYQEHDGGKMFWNYEDKSDTFTTVETLLDDNN